MSEPASFVKMQQYLPEARVGTFIQVSVEVILNPDIVLVMLMLGLLLSTTASFIVQVTLGKGTPTVLQSSEMFVITSTILSEG